MEHKSTGQLLPLLIGGWINDPAGTGIEGTFIVNRVPKFYIRVLAMFRVFLQAHVSIM